MKIGTRASPLALWQARRVATLLSEHPAAVSSRIVEIRTRGETIPDRSLAEIGVGVFTRELDEALRRGEIDLAVHSLKDVPSTLAEGIALAAVPERADPRDAWISADGTPLEAIPAGSRVGTGSPRRKAQLLSRRGDVEVVPLRGNVATRLRKISELGLAGTFLACAGLARLGREEVITEPLDPEVITPAVSQGAIGVSAREGDGATLALLEAIEDPAARVRIEAERAFLAELRGGCQVPAGALAEIDGDRLRLLGVIAAPDGSRCLRGKRDGSPSEAARLGSGLARDLLDRGGREVLAMISQEP